MYSKDELLTIWNSAYLKRGWLYAMENPYNPGIIKVGLTRKDPFKRSKTATTAGVIGKYNVLFAMMYLDCNQAEVKAHSELSIYNIEKELFKVDLAHVKQVLINIHQSELAKYPELNLSLLLYDLTPDRWCAQACY